MYKYRSKFIDTIYLSRLASKERERKNTKSMINNPSIHLSKCNFRLNESRSRQSIQ